jgi:D-alanyl-D-alanine dipeptidase
LALIEITPDGFGVELDLAYATLHNFTGAPIYRRSICYLHEDAARALASAVALATHLGLKIRVFDGLRPTEAQERLWAHTPDPEFLADPRRGSPHSRGVAVDLTLIGEDGTALDMGTRFDEFTTRSHHGSTEVPLGAQRNRLLLLGLMTAAGWDHYRNEWWHYQLFRPRAYPLLGDAALPRPIM